MKEHRMENTFVMNEGRRPLRLDSGFVNGQVIIVGSQGANQPVASRECWLELLSHLQSTQSIGSHPYVVSIE